MLTLMRIEHLIKKINYQQTHSHEHYLVISKTHNWQLKAIVERGIVQQDFVQLRLEHYQHDRH
jgi:hypothetical protein